MDRKRGFFTSMVLVLALWSLLLVSPVRAADPIILGCPLSTAFLYGWDAERGFTLAVEEINAAGGVMVGSQKRPLKMEVIDTRDLEPGVPVSEALSVWKNKAIWIGFPSTVYELGTGTTKQHALDLLRDAGAGDRLAVAMSTENLVSNENLRMLTAVLEHATLPLTEEKIDEIEQSLTLSDN